MASLNNITRKSVGKWGLEGWGWAGWLDAERAKKNERLSARKVGPKADRPPGTRPSFRPDKRWAGGDVSMLEISPVESRC